MARYWLLGLAIMAVHSGSVSGNGLINPKQGAEGLAREGVTLDLASAKKLVLKLDDLSRSGAAVAELASQRARTPKVRAYAERLLRDYRFLGRRNEEIAKRMRIELPHSSQKSVAGVPEELQLALGPDFDDLFLRWIREGHRAALDSMRRLLASIGEGSELETLATRIMPILQQHQILAIHLQADRMSEARGDQKREG